MISAPDRRLAVSLIDEARADARPTAVRPAPSHALTEDERQAVLATTLQPAYAALPPGQRVPRLADKGVYLASESTFYRVLRAHDLQHHRGRAKAPSTPRPPTTHCADKPNQVWYWDSNWLPGPIRGQFIFLYLIIDLYSRKIVGWEVYEAESSAHARDLVERTVWREGILNPPRVLHGDQVHPLKGAIVQALLDRLGIAASFSRPRVSDDNAEALFRALKYSPGFPRQGFVALVAARDRVQTFSDWYNTVHRHRGIQYVTPQQRHSGKDVAILRQRHELYEAARRQYPTRWYGDTRNWGYIREVWLNPENDRALTTKVA